MSIYVAMIDMCKLAYDEHVEGWGYPPTHLFVHPRDNDGSVKFYFGAQVLNDPHVPLARAIPADIVGDPMGARIYAWVHDEDFSR